MKKIVYILALVLAVTLVSCEIEPEVQISDPTPAELLNPTSNHAYNYTADNDKDDVLFVISEADYGFAATVTYTIQVDVRGGDFERPQNIVFAENDSLTVSVGSFARKVAKLRFDNKPGKGDDAEMDMRVKCYVSDGYPDIYSQTIPVTFKIY